MLTVFSENVLVPMSDPEMKFYTKKAGNCLYIAVLSGKIIGIAGAQIEDERTTINLACMSVPKPHLSEAWHC